MAASAGKDFLRTCLAKFGKSAEIDNLLCYKYGNKNSIDAYQNGNADAILTEHDIKRIQGGLPVVVKCFVKSHIYAGWHSGVVIGNGKCKIATSVLKDFETDTEQDYKVIATGSKDEEKVYLFRKESGIEKFFEEVLGLKKQGETK